MKTHAAFTEVTLIGTLLDDCIFSETSATDSGGRTLRYIPGATLYGAAAAKLYPDLRKHNRTDDLWELFHTDAIQFGNAYAIQDDLPAWPAPCTWQSNKGADLYNTSGHLATELINASAAEPQRGIQRKPLRGQFITPAGHFANPTVNQQLKTAFQPGKGTAEPSQLFQYEAVQTGQSFAAQLSRLEHVKTDLWDELIRTLDGATLRLGRSKGAQYGRVRIQVVPQPVNRWPLEPRWTDRSNDGRTSLTIWCVSDLCLLDEHLQPTTTPTAAAVGLHKGWGFEPGNSYVQTRRYSPYNAFRQSHDSERIVIAAGSVLTFKWTNASAPPQELASLRQSLGSWLGQHNSTGLGQVVIHPSWATQPQLNVTALQPTHSGHTTQRAESQTPTPAMTPTQTQWFSWIGKRANQTKAHDIYANWAKQKHSEVRTICQRAALLAPEGLAATTPTASQWGLVLEICRNNIHSVIQLSRALSHPGNVLEGASLAVTTPTRKQSNAWFRVAHYPHTRYSDATSRSSVTLGDWLLDQLHDPVINAAPGDALGRLASMCRRDTEASSSSTPSSI